MIKDALNSALSGITSGLNKVTKAANDIARVDSDSDPVDDDSDRVAAFADLKQGEQAVKANRAVIKIVDDLGDEVVSLLDKRI